MKTKTIAQLLAIQLISIVSISNAYSQSQYECQKEYNSINLLYAFTLYRSSENPEISTPAYYGVLSRTGSTTQQTFTMTPQSRNEVEAAAINAIPFGLSQKFKSNLNLKGNIHSEKSLNCLNFVKTETAPNTFKKGLPFFRTQGDQIYMNHPEIVNVQNKIKSGKNVLTVTFKVTHTIDNDAVYPGIPVKVIRYVYITLHGKEGEFYDNFFKVAMTKSTGVNIWSASFDGKVTIFHTETPNGKVISSVTKESYHYTKLSYASAAKFTVDQK